MTFTDQPDDPKTVTLSRKDIRRLEEQAKEGREAKERLAQLERERTFLQAGVPLDDRRAGYFIAGYQGENTPEAIKREWHDTFGASTPPAGQVDQHQAQIERELAAYQGAADMTSGAGTLPPNLLAERDAKLARLSPTDPYMDQKFREIMEEYGSRVYNPNTG